MENRKPPLYVLFTMDCLPAVRKLMGPRSWSLGGRTIETFCHRLMNRGYKPTLFATAHSAEEHAPMLQELGATGVEVGLYVYPQSLDQKRYKKHLGGYKAAMQSEIVELAKDEFWESVGHRPTSVRTSEFSANDDTYKVLFEQGFRQGSVSNPGRRVPKYQAVWTDAPTEPHYVSAESRLAVGTMPFLEVPVTTDAGQNLGGLAPELTLDGGEYEKWHRPLLEAHMARLEQEDIAFRSLCIYGQNLFQYYDEKSKSSFNLRRVLDYLDSLADTYDVGAVTMSEAHEQYRLSVPDPVSVQSTGL